MISFFRKTSAIKINASPAIMKNVPKKDGGSFQVTDRQGAIFVEGANGKDQVYDWSKKVSFAIAENDYTILMRAFKEYDASLTFIKDPSNDKKIIAKGYLNGSLIHDPNKGNDKAGSLIKTLSLTNGTNVGTYFLTILYTENKKQTSKVSISMCNGDLARLRLFIEQNMTLVVGAA